MHARLVMILALLLIAGTTRAGDNGLRMGMHPWFLNDLGSVHYRNEDPTLDSGYDIIRSDTGYLKLEHPLPLLPHAMVSRSAIAASTSGRVSNTLDFGGSSFTTGEDIASSIQLQRSDIILYYSIVDSVASIDLGVDARYIDSNTVPDGSMETANVTGWIPLLYAGIGLDLPFSGLTVSANGSFTGYQGHHQYEVALHASYTSSWKTGASLGYRSLKIGLENVDACTADIAFSGPYAGVFVNF